MIEFIILLIVGLPLFIFILYRYHKHTLWQVEMRFEYLKKVMGEGIDKLEALQNESHASQKDFISWCTDEIEKVNSSLFSHFNRDNLQ